MSAQNETRPVVTGTLGTASFTYDADRKQLGFANWRIADGSLDPANYDSHRAILDYLLHVVDEAEAQARS